MMARYSFLRFILAGFLISPRISAAAQLHVEPVLLELNAPAVTGVLTLRNNDNSEAVVQTRVVRWSQSEGNDKLDPATDVVASPPSVTMAPGADYVVRIVRVSKEPVREEESYRVIVDQLPVELRTQNRAVNVLIRQSIPVFFRARSLTAASVSWTVRYDGKKLIVLASNSGSEHLRIASLRLRDSAGLTLSYGSGLAGYVLGRSSKSWTFASHPAAFNIRGSVSVSAVSDKGPINATAQLANRP